MTTIAALAALIVLGLFTLRIQYALKKTRKFIAALEIVRTEEHAFIKSDEYWTALKYLEDW